MLHCNVHHPRPSNMLLLHVEGNCRMLQHQQALLPCREASNQCHDTTITPYLQRTGFTRGGCAVQVLSRPDCLLHLQHPLLVLQARSGSQCSLHMTIAPVRAPVQGAWHHVSSSSPGPGWCPTFRALSQSVTGPAVVHQGLLRHGCCYEATLLLVRLFQDFHACLTTAHLQCTSALTSACLRLTQLSICRAETDSVADIMCVWNW
jgi:hypothetical protein